MAIAAWEANISSVSSSSLGERQAARLVRYVDDADVLPPVPDGRAQEALHRPQRWADLGQADRRDMGGEVRHSDRLGTSR